MNFYKQVVILKERQKGYSVNGKELSGISRLECEDGTCNLSLSLINFASLSGGEYYCILCLENNSAEIFPLGKKPTGHIKTFSVQRPFKDFSVGIFALEKEGVKMGTPLMVAFARTDGGVDEDRLAEVFCDDIGREIVEGEYNDEAVATENYYSLDESIEKKVDLINGWDNEFVGDEVIDEYNLCQKEEKEGQSGDNRLQDEEGASKGAIYSTSNPYYLSAREELEELFSKFPKDETLASVLPTGRFCKIHYGKDKHYTVGTVEEKGAVKYVCYGVPGSYSPTPPEELKDYCSFIPISLFDLQGEGFWMMFQDAITGECVKKEKS